MHAVHSSAYFIVVVQSRYKGTRFTMSVNEYKKKGIIKALIVFRSSNVLMTVIPHD